MKCRCLRLAEGECVLAVDSTSKTGFGVKLTDVTWGTNKEGLKLPVTVEVVVYSLSDHVPVYYKTFAGNTNDSRTIDIILADLKEVGFTDYILVIDRGYYSLKNVDRFIKSATKIVACMKAGVGFSLSMIKKLGTFDYVPAGFTYDNDLDLYTNQFNIERTVRAEDGSTVKADKLRLNLYFDPVRRSATLKRLDRGLQEEREKLDAIVAEEKLFTSEVVEVLEEKYDLFSLNWKSHKVPIQECPDYKPDEHKRGPKKKVLIKYQLLSYERSETAMLSAKKTAGFRALITLGTDFTANEAMNHYSLRAEQEMDNEQWKTLFPCDRERTSTELSKAGSSFIQFVGRIMTCYLRYQWRSNFELRKMFKSTLTITDEMRRIRCVEYPQQSEMRLTPFIGKQLDICRILGFPVPKGCEPGS